MPSHVCCSAEGCGASISLGLGGAAVAQRLVRRLCPWFGLFFALKDLLRTTQAPGRPAWRADQAAGGPPGMHEEVGSLPEERGSKAAAPASLQNEVEKQDRTRPPGEAVTAPLQALQERADASRRRALLSSRSGSRSLCLPCVT